MRGRTECFPYQANGQWPAMQAKRHFDTYCNGCGPRGPLSDFDTEFAALFEPPLARVPVLERPSVKAFAAVRRARQPVILSGLMDSWPAFKRFGDIDYLCAIAGKARVHYRNLKSASINVRTYVEVYEESSFEGFVREIFHDPQAGKYLTQACLRRPQGWRQAFERSAYPALLSELARDLVPLPYYPDRDLYEANLWLGPGGQKSGLHFDEPDNFNCTIVGSKRWLLFPQHEHPRLLASGGFSDSIARGFHTGEEARFEHPARRHSRGYECVTQPGQILYLPGGYWHQVFSGPETNLALNYWYLPATQMLRAGQLAVRRRVGYGSRLRQLLGSTLISMIALKRLTKYAALKLTGKVPLPPPPIGPSGYDLRQL